MRKWLQNGCIQRTGEEEALQYLCGLKRKKNNVGVRQWNNNPYINPGTGATKRLGTVWALQQSRNQRSL